jgi:fatty acid desaturase
MACILVGVRGSLPLRMPLLTLCRLSDHVSPLLSSHQFYSTYFEKNFVFDAAAKFIISYQHYLYYPVMGVARVNLYAQSIILVADTSKAVRNRMYEVVALTLFWMWLTAIVYSLPDTWTRIYFILISHNMAGLTHVQITLSHFAMPVYEGRGYSPSSAPLAREHFLRTQFDTTLDVDCSRVWDWIHGGLQFQVTHHLIPKIPRHNLRYVREQYVKPFAKKHGLEYKSESFLDANQTVRSMAAITRPLSARARSHVCACC